jgi:hypothetical protein
VLTRAVRMLCRGAPTIAKTPPALPLQIRGRVDSRPSATPHHGIEDTIWSCTHPGRQRPAYAVKRFHVLVSLADGFSMRRVAATLEDSLNGRRFAVAWSLQKVAA